jgi:hypothetical protein
MKEAAYVRYAHIGIVAVCVLHPRPLVVLVVLSTAVVVVAHDRLLVGFLIGNIDIVTIMLIELWELLDVSCL